MIENGQKYESTAEAETEGRVVTVLDANPDTTGRIKCESLKNNRKRLVSILKTRLESDAYRLLPLLLILLLGACTGAQPKREEPKKAVSCQNSPQWFTSNEKGEPNAAVYVCFAADGTLLWQARAMSQEEMHKFMTGKPEPVPAKAKDGPPKNLPKPAPKKPSKAELDRIESDAKINQLAAEVEAAKAALQKKADVAAKVKADREAAEKLQAEANK